MAGSTASAWVNKRKNMFLRVQEVLEALQGQGGEQFECCVRDIVEAESRIHGISPADIDWDFRTSCADGGCDIFINHAHGQPNPRLIPEKLSLWSLKSGRDGIQTATLGAEISDHPRVIEHLREGGVYIWCALNPISQPSRVRMRQKVNELASEHGFNAELVKFVWIETIQTILNYHPNLIAIYAPKIAQRIQGVEVLEHWRPGGFDRQGYGVGWVDFAGREKIKSKVQDHLRGGGDATVIHIAGFSGVGKTRTVFQACKEDSSLRGVLYAPRFDAIQPEFLRAIEDSDLSFALVIDEVSLANYFSFSAQLSDYADRIRIVTIGPAPRGEQGKGSVPGLLILEPPTREEGLVTIIKQAASGLDDSVVMSIAEVSGNDIRLALMLVFATMEREEFQLTPIVQIDEVLDRITVLYADLLDDIAEFKKIYLALTFSVDVGCDGRFREEIEFVADFFDVPITELDRVIGKAHSCGLGLRTPQFFEATPRALAIRLFKDRFWIIIQPRISDFFEKAPSHRLKRRFIERCQEVDGSEREEILDSIGSFFFQYLGEFKITQIRDCEKSRVFQAWTELDPDRGLKWLVRAIDNSSDEDIVSLDEVPSFSGGWGARRQLVWLCEHLACFSEYFAECEKVLFRLAQNETEESIGNNSKNTWAALFMPVLSNTEYPFSNRLEILNKRFENATLGTVDLLMQAFNQIFEDPGGRIAPPRVIGGRLVPDEWRPETREGVRTVRDEALETLLGTISNLDDGIVEKCGIRIVQSIRALVHTNRIDLLKSFFAKKITAEHTLRSLNQAIDEVTSFVELRYKDKEIPTFYNELFQWNTDLEPGDIAEQVIDLTAREYWQVYRSLGRGKSSDDAVEVYVEMARMVINEPSLVLNRGEWFGSPDCKSGGALGLQLGVLDSKKVLFNSMIEWLRTGIGGDVAFEYIAGYVKTSGLDQDVIAFLEKSSESNPEMVLRLNLSVDHSAGGVRRAMACIGSVQPESIYQFRCLMYSHWEDVLDVALRVEVIGEMLEAANKGNQYSLDVAFFVVGGWYHGKSVGEVDHSIIEAIKTLVFVERESGGITDAHHWQVLMEIVLESDPVPIADLLADMITDGGDHSFQRGQYAEELFIRLAQKFPLESMDAIGKYIMDPDRSLRFRVFEYKGIFDAIGLSVVRTWVSAGRAEYVVNIARHLNGPSLDNEGNPVIPPLVDWLLTEFPDEKVFIEFCMGRHSGVTRVGHSKARTAEVQEFLKPFVAIDQEWVKKWVQYERDSFKSEILNDDRIHDEFDRT